MGPRALRIAALAFAVAAFGLAGCSAPKVIDSVWPRADAERAVPKPAGVPRWPLTGLEAPSSDAVKTRIVSVKIENSPSARPQSGLDQADIVYETVTEGGITRFNALFQSHSPAVIGPVRSARWSDLYIIQEYSAIFAHCGGETALQVALRDRKKYEDLDQFFNPAPFWRARDRSAPHNLYADVSRLRAAGITGRGYEAAIEVPSLAFARGSQATTPTVTQVTVPFAPDNKVTWRYDAASSTYARSINGKPHVDRISRKQYRARNVVVMWARALPRSHRDVAGTPVVEIVLSGTGRATIFRDGIRFDGTWEAGPGKPPVLRAANGQAIKLSPGVTWFQVIDNSQNIVMK